MLVRGTVIRALVFVLVAGTLAACSGPDVASGVYDPYEVHNRLVHEDNRALDRALVRPASNAYGNGLPEPIRDGIGNVASNLSVPGSIVNDILQGQLGDALHNTARFLLNSTLGLGGLLDPASDAGLEQRDADFGETLHVWGFKEGAYIELPIIGPSTSRAAVGKVVDLFLNPLNQFVPAPEKYALPIIAGASRVGDRYDYSGTVDSILYESEDSYAQARVIYLQNRRHQLSGDSVEAEEEAYDLYEESYE